MNLSKRLFWIFHFDEQNLAPGSTSREEPAIGGAGERFDSRTNIELGCFPLAQALQVTPFPMSKVGPVCAVIVVQQSLGVTKGIVVDAFGGDADLGAIGGRGCVLLFLTREERC